MQMWKTIFVCISLRTILFIFIFCILCKIVYKKIKRDSRLVKCASGLPGPFAWPLIGNGFNIYFGGKGGINQLLNKYSKNYGSIYRLWIGKHLAVVLTGSEELEVVFHNSSMLDKSELFQSFREFWGDVLFTLPTPIWRKHRKRLQVLFGQKTAKEQISEIRKIIHKHVEKIKTHVDGPEFNTSSYIQNLTFDIVTKTLFNVEFDLEEKSSINFVKHVNSANKINTSRMLYPWLHDKFFTDLLHGKELKRAKDAMLKFSKKVVNKKFNTVTNDTDGSNAEIPPLLSTFCELQKEIKNDNVLFDQIADMMAAGTGTMAATNSFFTLMVAMHPQVQEKLYTEIHGVLGDDDRMANVNDIERLPYLDQVLKETLRRFTILPLVLRRVGEDCKIGSHIFPAGTTLIIDIDSIHHNPKYYQNPYEFNPENFNAELTFKRPKYAFIPFSAGSRNCIGKINAEIIAKLFMITLLRNFTLHTDMKIEKISLTTGFVVNSVDSYKLRIKSRN